MITVLATLALLPSEKACAREKGEPAAASKGQYADVNGLKMYYEVHGAGKRLVLLHGAFGWASAYPALANNRRLIAVELQGHGRTAEARHRRRQQNLKLRQPTLTLEPPEGVTNHEPKKSHCG